jgi:hypothetical protein
MGAHTGRCDGPAKTGVDKDGLGDHSSPALRPSSPAGQARPSRRPRTSPCGGLNAHCFDATSRRAHARVRRTRPAHEPPPGPGEPNARSRLSEAATIRGRVTTQDGGQPVVSAQVLIVGTTTGRPSPNNNGEYLDSGSRRRSMFRFRAIRIGFQPQGPGRHGAGKPAKSR